MSNKHDTIVDQAYQGGLEAAGSAVETVFNMFVGSKSEPTTDERIADALEKIADKD